MRMTTLAVITAATLPATAAFASEDKGCIKAKEQWLSIGEIEAKLKDQGYQVSEIEIESGCAEAKVRDKDGKTAELYLDPATGAISKSEDDD
jgi:hypothetical protein